MKKLWLAPIILVCFAITSFAEKKEVAINADDAQRLGLNAHHVFAYVFHEGEMLAEARDLI